MSNKMSTSQMIGAGGFVAVVVSMFLKFNSPEDSDAESLFKAFTKPEDEGGMDLAIWMYLLLALAAVGAYAVYSGKKSFALLAAGVVGGFVLYFLSFNSIYEGGWGIGLILALAGAAAAIFATYKLSEEK